MNAETRPLTIVVTPDDIRYGIRNDFANCPIARAVHRRLTNAGVNVALISVDTDRIAFDIDHWNPNAFDIYISTPKRATNFIRAFDSEQPVHPTRFTLDVPAEAFAQ